MIKNKKILYISPRYFYPANDWAKIVFFNTIKELSKNNQIDYITNVAKEDLLYINEAIKYITNFKYILKNVSKQEIIKLLKSLILNKSYFFYKYYDKKILDYIDELFNKNNYDIVWIESAYMTIYAKYIRKKYKNVKIVSRSHNVEYLLLERIWQEEKSFINKFLINKEARYWKNIEWHYLNYCDKIFSITECDKNELIKINNLIENKIEVLYPWVDLIKYNNKTWITNEKNLVFIWTMSYFPNIQAVKWFKENIFDEIIKIDKDIKLYIIWKWATDEIKKLASINIIVEDWINSDVFYFDKSRIFIVPLLSWSWLKLKVINAMSMWKTVLSTTIWTEWIPIKNWNNLFETDNIDEWKKIILEYIWNSEKLNTIWNNWRKLIEEKFDWQKIFNKVNL